MSYSFAGIALPGGIPTAGSGSKGVTPESLFRDKSERDRYRMILENGQAFGAAAQDMKVKSIKVRTFDLSDREQADEYEELMADLINRSYMAEVIVFDSRKDLVSRGDGTSYWLKYVEYAEMDVGNGKDSERTAEGDRRAQRTIGE